MTQSQKLQQLEAELNSAIERQIQPRHRPATLSTSQSRRSSVELVELWNEKGNDCRDAEQYEEAHVYYRKALELARQHEGDPAMWSSSSSFGSDRSSSSSHQDDSDTSSSSSSSSLRHATEETSSSSRYSASVIAGNLGVAASDLGRDQEAHRWYEEALEEMTSTGTLTAATTTTKSNQHHKQQQLIRQLNVARTWNNLGTLYSQQGQYPQARHYLEQALDKYFVSLTAAASSNDSSATPTRTPGFHSSLPDSVKTPDVAFTYHNLGHLCLQHDRLDEAAVFLETALDIHEHCRQKNPERTSGVTTTTPPPRTTTTRAMMATLEALGELCVELGRYAKALEYYQRVLGLLEPQQQQPPRENDPAAAEDHQRTLGILGVLSFELGKYVLAKEYLEATVALFQQHGNHHQHPEDLAGTLDYLSRIEAKLGNPQLARRYERQSLRLLAQVDDDHPAAAMKGDGSHTPPPSQLPKEKKKKNQPVAAAC